ncbi:MAG: class IIb bacteriocin, lactobin A/cerein 7B family [Acidithiobacillus ferriphilus]|jgi:lactobin A/cerein 7B family class IIb bacteriocin|nr:class IIb bacteriocin, lactobin A/cerein 7B family [Acidithiobacillus ferriphilus]
MNSVNISIYFSRGNVMEYIEIYGMRELDQDELATVNGGYIPVGPALASAGGGLGLAGAGASFYGQRTNSAFWTNLGGVLGIGGAGLSFISSFFSW